MIAIAVEVRDLRPEDWPEVAQIFGEGIATGNATFETEVPSWNEWDAAHLAEHRFVAVREGRVLGWIALVPASSRGCYAGVAEVSIYVSAKARGEGVAGSLVPALIDSSERGGIWTLQTGVFPENDASVELCRRFGFRVVGTRERIGRLHGVWRDVLLLERRSEVVTGRRCTPTMKTARPLCRSRRPSQKRLSPQRGRSGKTLQNVIR